MHRTGHISYHHILHNIAPHLIVNLIPHPTTMFHITFHITHQHTTTVYIPPLAQSRITPLPRIYLIPHRTTFPIPCHSTHQSILHHHFPGIIPFQFEKLGTICDPFCYALSFTWNLLYHIPNPSPKMVVEKFNFIHKVPEKVIPLCPNTNLSGSLYFLFDFFFKS